jgi:hypothetical protein
MKYSLRSLIRFSLRDLFWITVAVALVLAWWVDRSRLEAENQKSQLQHMETEEATRIQYEEFMNDLMPTTQTPPPPGYLTIRAFDTEQEAYREAAKRAEKPLSEWAREHLNKAAKQSTQD